MEAKVIATGEVVEVNLVKNTKSTYVDSNGHFYNGDKLEFIPDIDWEQRRFELVKQMLPQASVFANDSLLASGDNNTNVWDAASIIACKFADAVIEKLK